MEHVSPGIIINVRFCQANSKPFAEYIRYIDREEAIRSKNFDMFSLYNNYMENPEKSTGIFTADKDKLTLEENIITKEIFHTAQANGSLMWQPIISFDNDFLEENGLYDKKTLSLNEAKIRELTRGTVHNILKGENMEDSSFWTASIHYNTDNIHIHLAIVEPEPQREKILTGNYAGQVKGTFKQSSITAGKRFAVNYVLDNQLVNSKINEIIRDNIISKKKQHPLYKDKEFIKEYMRIHDKLPKDKRQWNYSMNGLNNIRPDLDSLISLYLKKYHSQDMEELKKLLEKQERVYRRSYGKSDNNFAQNKIDDLYKRLGNVILKEMKEYDREIKKSSYNEAKKEASSKGKKVTQKDLQIYVYQDTEEEEKERFKRNGTIKKEGTPKKKDIRYRHKSSCLKMIGTVEKLKRAMRDEFQHARNEYEHEMLQHSIERENQQRERERENNDLSF